MELQDVLAPVSGEFDADEALSTWRWLVTEHVKPLAITAFGDLFATTSSRAVAFLDTVEGTYAAVAGSVVEWEEKCRNPDLFDRWFMPAFLAQLHEAGSFLSQGECYDATHPIILGGAFSVMNWSPTNWRSHFHSLGQIHEQVKDLPNGTAITKIHYTKL